MSAPVLDIAAAAAILARGGVIAYPTEAVWGLGCDPLDHDAVARLLQIKQRAVDKGLILVASQVQQLHGLVDLGALPAARLQVVQASWPGPHSWIVPVGPGAPAWISGQHRGIAVRISAHPTVRALCEACGHALVSTSANLAGEPAASRRDALDPRLLQQLDGVMEGETGGAARPSTLADALTGAALRI